MPIIGRTRYPSYPLSVIPVIRHTRYPSYPLSPVSFPRRRESILFLFLLITDN